MFTMDNTDGYTQAELDNINEEWNRLVESKGLIEGSDEYHQEAARFSDEVAAR